MPDWLTVIILGVVEGITEFLPISSTGHLLILGHWLTPQGDLFNVVIQSGAVVAIIPLFSQRCRDLLFRWQDPATRRYAGQILLAFAITGIGGVILENNDFHLPETIPPVASALLLGGLLFLVAERIRPHPPASSDITWTIAVAVGLGQLIAAVFPGASRSGTTMLLALLLGLGRPAATEFSFLVGIPTMLAAGGLKITKALLSSSPETPPVAWDLLALGTVVSGIVAFVAVKWLLRFVQTHTFAPFGYYRIGLALLLFLAPYWKA